LHAARIVTTAYYTGMRAGEIFGLTWDKIHLKEGYIELEEEDTKTSELRRIYLAPVLEEMIQKLFRVRHISRDFVLTYKGEPLREIKGAFNRACKKAGIKDFRFHDLRHTFASHLLLNGGALADIRDILGHKDMTMTLRYAHLSGAHKRQAVNLLNNLTGDQDQEQKIVSIGG